MNSFLYLGDNINTININASPSSPGSSTRSPRTPNGLGKSLQCVNKCTSSVLLSNVTVSTSINSKTKIIENQTITLKRQASNSFNSSPFNFKKNHVNSSDKPIIFNNPNASHFELSAIEYGSTPESSRPKFKFGMRNDNASLRRKKNYLLNPVSSAASITSETDLFMFNYNNNISPVKKVQVDENGAFINNEAEKRSEETTFEIPNVSKFEFSLHRKLTDFRKISTGSFRFGLNQPTGKTETPTNDNVGEYFHFKPFEEYETANDSLPNNTNAGIDSTNSSTTIPGEDFNTLSTTLTNTSASTVANPANNKLDTNTPNDSAMS